MRATLFQGRREKGINKIIMEPSPAHIVDLVNLFEKTFGQKPYVLTKAGELSTDPGQAYQITKGQTKQETESTPKGSLIKEIVNGVFILLPVRFYDGSTELMHLPYVVVSIRGRKMIIKTPMVERKGSVKEMYAVDDYAMTVKGFLIADDRKFPEALLIQMKELCERKTAVTVDNALFNLFLDDKDLPTSEQRRVVIADYQFPEVTGGRHVRPFVLQLESDTVFTLELNQ